MTRDLSREDLPAALLAWVDLAGCADPPSSTLPASLAWLSALWGAGDDHLSLTLVHDLGHLLLRGRDFRFASSRLLTRWDESERAARLAYEDRVLGRWVLDPTVIEAHVAISGMPAKHRDAAVAHAVGLALARPTRSLQGAPRGNAAHLRAAAQALVESTPDDPDARREKVGPEWHAWAVEQLSAALEALPRGRLFRPEDLWEVAHLPDLPSDSARLSLREVNGLAARVGGVSPSVALRLRHTAREVPVEAEESDHYPAGGFDAISTKGSFENLVRSEVAYVGEGTEEADGVDLFDVRFAEGELLFYTRDESPLLDARRDVTVVIDRPAQQRHKHPALESQTLVLAQALALTLQADLVRAFGPAGSRCGLVWLAPRPEDLAAAEEERALLVLPLGAEVAHRRVSLDVARSWEDVPDAGRVVISPLSADAGVAHAAWVRVGEAEWSLDDERFDLRDAPTALRALGDRLLAAVTRPRRARKRRKG